MIVYFRNGIEIARHDDRQDIPPGAYPGARAIKLAVAQATALSRVGDPPPEGEADVRPFAEPSPAPALLAAYAGSVRYAAETAGIVVSGLAVPTDRASQATIIGAVVHAQAIPTYSTRWKDAAGNFSADMSATQIIALGQAVAAHVSNCYAREADAVDAITANTPTITTFDQVDAFFAGL